jgi:hypothetical protein
MNDCVLALMLKKKIPLTQRSYIELAYIGDKHSIEELGVEEMQFFLLVGDILRFWVEFFRPVGKMNLSFEAVITAVALCTAAELAVDDHLGLIHFVPFIPHHLCGSNA